MFSKSYDMLKSGGPGCTLSVLTILNRCTSVLICCHVVLYDEEILTTGGWEGAPSKTV
jgi:hypothetical protein